MPKDQVAGSASRALPSARRESVQPRRTLLALVIVLLLLAGQMQNLALAVTKWSWVTNVDDLLLVAAVLIALPRLRRGAVSPALWMLIWVALIGVAAFRSAAAFGFPVEDLFFQARQVAVPALLALVGFVLTRAEWRTSIRWTVGLALVNVAYIFGEKLFGRPVDPLELQTHGYVGYYNGNDLFTGERVVRAGGMLLNPPIMGLFLAAALAFVVYTRPRFRIPIAIALGLALMLTISRGGLLAAAIAVVLPWAARRFNAWVAGAVLVVAVIPAGVEVATHAGSAVHVRGLVAGFEHSISTPLGMGLGFVGNHRPGVVDAQMDGAGESLLAIPFSAVGLTAVILIGVLVAILVQRSNLAGDQGWVSALALGGVAAALFAETASGLNGTVPIWLALGVALRPLQEEFRVPDLAKPGRGLS